MAPPPYRPLLARLVARDGRFDVAHAVLWSLAAYDFRWQEKVADGVIRALVLLLLAQLRDALAVVGGQQALDDEALGGAAVRASPARPRGGQPQQESVQAYL